MIDKIQNKKLREIAEKVNKDIPVNKEDAAYMLKTNDILDLGYIANHIRMKLHQYITYFSVNMNLNYTNICELRCPLCAFSRDEKDNDAYLFSLDEIENKVIQAVSWGVNEIHIVGGLNPILKINYFEEMIKRIKKVQPNLFVVAFTAVEYDYFSKINGISLEDVFKILIDAGVDALPGGGAEIFSQNIRDMIAPKKISGKRWLEVMRNAHSFGLKTNATMLYNHKEKIDDIVDHLFKLRELQDETFGFKTFVPLQFHGENTQIDAKMKASTGYDDIRIYSTSRIVLRNIPHIKALWMYTGDKMAQVLLKFGVDDISGTYYNEKVVHAAGAKTNNFGSESHLKYLIENAGFKPFKTTAGYYGDLTNETGLH